MLPSPPRPRPSDVIRVDAQPVEHEGTGCAGAEAVDADRHVGPRSQPNVAGLDREAGHAGGSTVVRYAVPARLEAVPRRHRHDSGAIPSAARARRRRRTATSLPVPTSTSRGLVDVADHRTAPTSTADRR